MKWAMVIDLKKCVGCYSCSAACKTEHSLPRGVCSSRLVVPEKGKYPPSVKVNLPMPCNHCDQPSCTNVCPSGGTFKREDGIVAMDYQKCTKCQLCVAACPYHMRMSLDHAKGEVDQRWYDPSKDYGGSPIRLEKGDIVKCNFCLHRITLGFKRGLRHGVDREATPACVNACNAGARMFGDLDDPGSEISRVLRERKVFRLRPELATQPSVYYISNGYTFYNLDKEQR